MNCAYHKNMMDMLNNDNFSHNLTTNNHYCDINNYDCSNNTNATSNQILLESVEHIGQNEDSYNNNNSNYSFVHNLSTYDNHNIIIDKVDLTSSISSDNYMNFKLSIGDEASHHYEMFDAMQNCYATLVDTHSLFESKNDNKNQINIADKQHLKNCEKSMYLIGDDYFKISERLAEIFSDGEEAAADFSVDQNAEIYSDNDSDSVVYSGEDNKFSDSMNGNSNNLHQKLNFEKIDELLGDLSDSDAHILSQSSPIRTSDNNIFDDENSNSKNAFVNCSEYLFENLSKPNVWSSNSNWDKNIETIDNEFEDRLNTSLSSLKASFHPSSAVFLDSSDSYDSLRSLTPTITNKEMILNSNFHSEMNSTNNIASNTISSASEASKANNTTLMNNNDLDKNVNISKTQHDSTLSMNEYSVWDSFLRLMGDATSKKTNLVNINNNNNNMNYQSSEESKMQNHDLLNELLSITSNINNQTNATSSNAISSSSIKSNDFNDSLLTNSVNRSNLLNKNINNNINSNNNTNNANLIHQQSFCGFCRNNGESELVYKGHKLKDALGRVSCPVLRSYTCPICSSSGDLAHTIKYCPQNNKEEVLSKFKVHETPRTSAGKRRISKISPHLTTLNNSSISSSNNSMNKTSPKASILSTNKSNLNNTSSTSSPSSIMKRRFSLHKTL